MSNAEREPMLSNRLLALGSLTLLSTLGPSLAGCSGDDAKHPASQQREEGQTEFESAPPITQGGGSFGAERGGATSDNAAAAPAAPGAMGVGVTQAKPEETDIYR